MRTWEEERLLPEPPPEPSDLVKAAPIQAAATLAAAWTRIQHDKWLADPHRDPEEDPANHYGALLDHTAQYYHNLARYQDWTAWPPPELP